MFFFTNICINGILKAGNYTYVGGISMASLVYLKHKNGTTYVYENVSYWDKKSKKPKSKRKCIGHLDPETGTVQPNGMRGGNQKNITTKSEKEPPKCFTYSCGVSG